MPSSTVTSSPGTSEMWRRIRSEERLVRNGDVDPARELGRMPQSAAADQWLRTASGPEASTAAIHRPSLGISRWPTA